MAVSSQIRNRTNFLIVPDNAKILRVFHFTRSLAFLCVFWVCLTSVSNAQASTEEDLFNDFEQSLDNYGGRAEKLLEARHTLERLLEIAPESAYSYCASGRFIYVLGFKKNLDYDLSALRQAQALFSKAIDINPNFFEPYYYYSYALIREKSENSLSKAKIYAQKAREINGESPRIDLLNLEFALLEKNYNLAISINDKILASNSDRYIITVAMNRIVWALIDLGMLDKVEDYYMKTINIWPESAWSYHNYASFLLNFRHDYDSAIAYEQIALSIMDFGLANKVIADAYYSKYQNMKKNNSYEEKISILGLCIKHNPDNYGCNIETANVYIREGTKRNDKKLLSDSILFYNKAITINPNNPRNVECTNNIKVAQNYINNEPTGYKDFKLGPPIR